MLSIERTHAAVVACCASPPALDTLPPIPGTHACRVAPDELLLVAPPSLLAEIEPRVAGHFATAEPTALVLDQTDGWSVFSLRGDEARSVFAQLSTVPLPTGPTAFVQGAVAGGSAKILVVDGIIHLLVPSTLRHHVAARLNDVCVGRSVVPTTEIAFVSEWATASFNRGAATPALR